MKLKISILFLIIICLIGFTACDSSSKLEKCTADDIVFDFDGVQITLPIKYSDLDAKIELRDITQSDSVTYQIVAKENNLNLDFYKADAYIKANLCGTFLIATEPGKEYTDGYITSFSSAAFQSTVFLKIKGKQINTKDDYIPEFIDEKYENALNTLKDGTLFYIFFKEDDIRSFCEEMSVYETLFK